MNNLSKIKNFSNEIHNKGIKSYKAISFINKMPKIDKEFCLKNIQKVIECIKKIENIVLDAKIAKELEGKTFGYSVKKYFKMKHKANEIAKCFRAGYSRGGTVNVYIKNNTKVMIGGSDSRTYYKGSKYKPLHSNHSIIITKKELEQIKIIGGIPTIVLENKKISKCIMFVGSGNKNSYQIHKKEGFVTSSFHSFNMQECIDFRKKRVSQLLIIREQKKNLDIFRAEQKILIEKKKISFVGFNHSISAGNCKTGTEMFISKHNLNKEFGYRLDYLIQLEPNNNFIKKLLYTNN